MATPLTGATAQFLPEASLRVTDPAMYAQIRTDYGLTQGGTTFEANGFIVGVSPATLAARYGINYVNNPTTSDYQLLPCVFTVDATSTVIATVVPANLDGVQTLTGQNFTDAHGVHFTSVTWEWITEVSLFRVLDAGLYAQELVQWTGDGSASRLVPTTLDLSEGVIAIWGAGGVNGGGTDDANFFRHNQSTMAGTAVCGIGGDPLTDGILNFVAAGFNVSAGTSSLKWANTLGVNYTAVVCKDTTFDNRYLRVGSYVGTQGNALTVVATQGSAVITRSSGPLFDPSMTGTTITDPSANNYIFTYVSPSVGNLSAAYIPVPSNPVTMTFGAGTRTILAPAISAFPSTVTLTHVWVWGIGVAYKSVDIAGSTSVDLVNGANGAKPTVSMITSLGIDRFSITDAVVANQSVNTANRKFNFMALNADAAFLAQNLFTSAQVTTPASLPSVVSGLPFSPGIIFGRQGDSTTFSDGAIWRGPAHTGTSSTYCATPGGSNAVTTLGIPALSGTSASFQSKVAHTTSQPYWYWAFVGGTGSPTFPVPTWVSDNPITLPDGTTANVEESAQQQVTPGAGWHMADPADAPQWWCYTSLGLSIFQLESPGAGWVACVGPASINGWYLSSTGFANASTIVSAGRPADPRPWEDLATWCNTGHLNVYGGSPAASCLQNVLVYPASGYTVGTNDPPVRGFNGRSDRELCRIPPSTTAVTSKAVITILAANDTIYLSTWDAGTTSANWTGRVFNLDVLSGALTLLGTVFAAGELPYTLAWHMGRLWVGTNNGIGTVGKVYFFRPGIDTVWTLDHATSSESAGGVTSMVSYKGKLYVGTDNAAASSGKVLVRDSLGAWTTSLTGPGTAINNGFPTLTVFGTNLYASYWDNTAPTSLVKKFDNSSWSTVYTGTGATNIPFLLLPVQLTEMYVVGGAKPYDAALLVTADGTTFTDLSAELPSETATLLPMFGAVGSFF